MNNHKSVLKVDVAFIAEEARQTCVILVISFCLQGPAINSLGLQEN